MSTYEKPEICHVYCGYLLLLSTYVTVQGYQGQKKKKINGLQQNFNSLFCPQLYYSSCELYPSYAQRFLKYSLFTI